MPSKIRSLEVGVKNPYVSYTKKVSPIARLLWDFPVKNYVESKAEVIKQALLDKETYSTEMRMKLKENNDRFQNEINKLEQKKYSEQNSRKERIENKQKRLITKEITLQEEYKEKLQRQKQDLLNERNQLLLDFENNKKKETNVLNIIIKDIDETIEAIQINTNNVPLSENIQQTLKKYRKAEKINTKEIFDLYKELKDDLVDLLLPEEEQQIHQKTTKTNTNSDQQATQATQATQASLNKDDFLNMCIAATSFISPITLIGSGSSLVKKIRKVHGDKKYLTEILSGILSIKYICVKLKEIIAKRPKPNVERYNEIYKRIKMSIDKEYANSLAELEEENESFRKDQEALKDTSFTKTLDLEIEKNKYNMKTIEEEITDEGNKILAELTRKVKERVAEFEEKNRLIDIYNKEIQEIFDEIKQAKKNIMDFLTYSDYTSMDLEGKDLQSEDPIERGKAEYDRQIKEELIPKVQDIVNVHDNFDDFKKDYDSILRKEDKLYLLDYGKVSFGKLIQPSEYIVKYGEFYKGYNLSPGSILFVYRNEEELDILSNLIKQIIQQILASMHTSAIEVAIINPNKIASFNDLAVNTSYVDENGKKVELGKYVTVMSDDAINEHKEMLERTFNKRQSTELSNGDRIDEVIIKKRLKGSMTPKYYINIILDGKPNNDFDIYQNDSESTGIINFRLISRRYMLEEKLDTKTEKMTYNMSDEIKDAFYRVPNLIEVSGILDSPTEDAILTIFSKKSKTMCKVLHKNSSRQQFQEISSHLRERFIQTASSKTAFTISEFILELTGGKYYQENTREYVKIYLGREDGDTSKLNPVILDMKAYPHAYFAGITGGGKSVALNCIINCWKVLYSPRELDVRIYDAKVVEVALHEKPYQWSVCSAMAGSGVSDYAVSFIADVVKEMNDRQILFTSYGTNNYADYRKDLEKAIDKAKADGDFEKVKELEKRWKPQLIMVVDEFVALLEISPEAKEAVLRETDSLLRLARSMGIHILLLSQTSPSAMGEKTFGQFAVRGCTKATKTISMEVMGNDFCARPENQFLGFFGINDNISREEQYNRFFLVPFSNKNDNFKYSKLSEELALKYTPDEIRKAVIYSDDDFLTFKDADRIKKDYPTDIHNIILGEWVKYMREYEFARLKLLSEAMSHLCIVSSSNEDRMRILKILFKHFNEYDIPTAIFFPKEPPEGMDWKNAIKVPLYQEERLYRGNKEINYILYTQDQYKYALLDKNFDTDVQVTQEILDERLQSGYYENRGFRADIFTSANYDKRQRNDDSLTMIGVIKEHIRMFLDGKKEKHKDTPKDQIKRAIMIIYMPELDTDIVDNRSFATDTEFKALMAEASEWNILVITITTQYSRYGDMNWNRFILGKSVGEVNADQKMFKKLEPELAVLVDRIDPTNTCKVKLLIEGE